MNTHKRIALGFASLALAGGGLGGGVAAAADGGEATTQSRQAGLTTTQSAELQRQVDAVIAESGGRQVAANIVDLGHGASVRLVVPGEKYVRDLATTRGPVTAPIQAVCPYKDFCAYQGTNYTGHEQRFGECYNEKLKGQGWSGSGSWYNNQSQSYMRAEMYGKAGNRVYRDDGPGSHDQNANWRPVWSIKPC
ncbi:peptidase inhibitor family I36 protein [Streptomyces sp. C184]|uniref:peptidase inhibitor family I36 protein n=1 Tax=Streptomyces sp. C184 TaxID=3237121 RepID=UPI0034C67E19